MSTPQKLRLLSLVMVVCALPDLWVGHSVLNMNYDAIQCGWMKILVGGIMTIRADMQELGR